MPSRNQADNLIQVMANWPEVLVLEKMDDSVWEIHATVEGENMAMIIAMVNTKYKGTPNLTDAKATRIISRKVVRSA